jgi:quinol-cytochrome oxidoreductase complex cytochrome b subunit
MWNLSLATVITNLLSAIPVFGQDLVELIWKYDFTKSVKQPLNTQTILNIHKFSWIV